MKKLLIVEDDPAYSFELEQLFKDQLEVEKTVDGISALSQINSGRFDVIILDIDILGEVDGLQILKTIKKDQQLKKTPVIVLTNTGPQRKQEFISEGASEYMVKGDILLEDLQKKVIKYAESIPDPQPGDN